MSNLALGFLTPWQAKQFSLRIGATSLMKLTGPTGAAALVAAASWAAAGFGAANRSRYARARPTMPHRTHRQVRGRSMKKDSRKAAKPWATVGGSRRGGGDRPGWWGDYSTPPPD